MSATRPEPGFPPKAKAKAKVKAKAKAKDAPDRRGSRAVGREASARSGLYLAKIPGVEMGVKSRTWEKASFRKVRVRCLSCLRLLGSGFDVPAAVCVCGLDSVASEPLKLQARVILYEITA